MKNKIFKTFFCQLFFVVLFTIIFSGCKKFIDVDVPVTKVSELSVYNSDATATAVLTGIYTRINAYSIFADGFPTLSKYAGLSADELTLFTGVTTPSLIAYYTNKLTAVPSTGSEIWQMLYPYIYTTNAAIEGLSVATALTGSVKTQLLGESYFLRAWFYFYLVNLYGEVPLVLTTNAETNRLLAKESVHNIYLQIISDLQKAKQNLSEVYLDATLIKQTTERVRPTKSVAAALLARVYLFIGEWQNAINESQIVINNSAFSLSGLNATFLKNSTEAIWQMQPVVAGYNTQEAVQYVLPAGGPNTFFQNTYLSSDLVNSFESGDLRKTAWIKSVTNSSGTYYYANKYKINNVDNLITTPAAISEYLMALRLSEQYLIRAEAKTQLNDFAGAKIDLNIVRTRAGLLNTLANDKASLLDAILKERRVEFFTEWGHRWLDLKRSSLLDAIMSSVAVAKGSTWQSFQKLYPIPQADILKNVNLKQNDGY